MAYDIRELLDSCSLLESRVAQLYFTFAEIFAAQPELAELWKKTAVEEENHMHQFQFAARLERSTAFTALVDPALVQRAIDMVARITEKVVQTPPGEQAALKLAIDLEEKLSQLHADSAMEYSDDSVGNLFKAMMANDEQHIQSLRHHLARYTAA